MQITDEYAAGFFDGEGCVRISRVGERYKLQVKISQLDRRPLDLLSNKYGGVVYESSRCPYWEIASRQASTFLSAILPYLIVKKKEAEIAVEFQATMFYRGRKPVEASVLAARTSMHDQMKALKCR